MVARCYGLGFVKKSFLFLRRNGFRKNIKLFFIFSTLFLTSCTLIDIRDSELVKLHTKRIYNQETNIISFIGPDVKPEIYWTVRLHAEGQSANSYQYLLRARIDYGNHMFGFARYDEYYPTEQVANGFGLQDFSCRGNRITFTDSMAIQFTREDLEKKIKTGINFTLQCQDGSRDLSIPGEYIRGFLEAVQDS